VIVFFHLVNGRGGVGSGTVTRVLSQPETTPSSGPGATPDGYEPGHRSDHDRE
jgi:hypothetical protein